MTDDVVVVVSLQAAEGRGDELIAAFEDGIVASHGDAGCISYAMHRDKRDPDHVVLIEHWRSQADIDAHMAQPHMGEMMKKTGAPGLLAGRPSMWFLDQVPIGDPSRGVL